MAYRNKYADSDIGAVIPNAEAGDAEAQEELGFRYDAGGAGVDANQGKAAQWFEKSAAQGQGHAQLFMGNYCMFGKGGVAKDEAKAFEWYQKAAATVPDGAAELGLCYLLGAGVAKDEAKGKALLRKAMQQGSRIAKEEMKERGIGIPASTLKICCIAGAIIGGLTGLRFGFIGLVLGAIAGLVAGGLVNKFVIAPRQQVKE